ncbi:type II toxin-antitoxin system CcdA family antitoxin [Halomonas sp. GXIMD04776]|uniref:type II toxin-antitoxin system CcdA family antitoxin n=1 Tax=Halomonas sp. GXIMD04776 TaxID=3415605 RepID=UPI003CA3F41C
MLEGIQDTSNRDVQDHILKRDVPFLLEDLEKREANRWVEENRTAIKSYSEFVDQHECFGDVFGGFDGLVQCLSQPEQNQ